MDYLSVAQGSQVFKIQQLESSAQHSNPKLEDVFEEMELQNQDVVATELEVRSWQPQF